MLECAGTKSRNGYEKSYCSYCTSDI